VTPPLPPWRSFALVPLVAAGAWYVLMLGTLLIVNGRLRWRTDVMAMAIGAVVLGLPTAIAVTAILVLPGYLVLRQLRAVSFAATITAGAVIGLAAWLVISAPSGDSTILSPVRGPLIGVITAVAWWYTGGSHAASR
jgi:hypothetical protein